MSVATDMRTTRRSRNHTERRARTTPVALRPGAQNGTSRRAPPGEPAVTSNAAFGRRRGFPGTVDLAHRRLVGPDEAIEDGEGHGPAGSPLRARLVKPRIGLLDPSGSSRPGSNRRLSAAPVVCGLQHDPLAHDRILAVEVVAGLWYSNHQRLLAGHRKRPRGERSGHRQPRQANPLTTPLIRSKRPRSTRSITGFRGR